MRKVTPEISFPQMEVNLLEQWEKNRVFEQSVENRRGSQEFSFYDGPPFANGLPHYGHLLANTIKDIVPRYWTMRGRRVERRFGWDCHGLPVEYEIEKREGLKGRTDILALGIPQFNEMCRSSVLHYTAEWQKTITRLGRWVSWENQYRTMDPDFMESVWWVFKSLFDKGLVYRSHKVVPYSPRITAVLSNFEANQNYKDVQDPAIVVKFKLSHDDAHLLAWTTTPWTLVSNLGLAVGGDIDYVRVRDHETGEVYILAEKRLESVYKPKGKDKAPAYDVLQQCKGSELAGLTYEPLYPHFKNQPHAFRVLAGDFVSTEDGTGIVHMAPAFGEDDFRLCREAGIELVDPLDDEGRFTDQVPEYQGQFVKDADKNIIKELKDRHKILRHDTIVHSYPMCERTDTPLIYRAIPAWYVSVEKIKDELVANNQEINWVPAHIKNGRMGKWLENARDWAISRNRFWGTPLPIWVCEKDDSHIRCLGSIAELQEATGAKVTDLHKHYVDDLTMSCGQCGKTMRRIPEVFDCWFESGSMPYAQLHYPFENKERFEHVFPADFIAEGLDQTRGWFYTLAVLSTALFNKPAFKNVVVNGLILAEDGRKMSKRWRNFTPPEELLGQFGADSIRLYMLNSAVLRGEDLKFSNQGVKDITRAALLPLWNAYSFLTTYADADSWKPDASLAAGKAPQVTQELDRWIISRLNTTVGRVHEEMEAYNLFNVVPVILGFVEDLTNWYIRLSRRRFWGGSGTLSEDSRQAYETLYFVLLNFTKIIAPFTPFVADEMHQGLVDGLKGVPASVHLTDIPVFHSERVDAALEERMALVRRVAEMGRQLRAKHQIKTRQVLPGMLVIARKQSELDFLQKSLTLLKNELNVKDVTFSTEETRYVNLSLKPNLRTLGKKLGSQLKSVKDKLEAMNAQPAQVAAFLQQVEDRGEVEFEGVVLSLEDLLIDRGPKDDRLIATDRGVTVLLDTHLTEELIQEGLAREVVNRIQNMRKDAGLDVTDRIRLTAMASLRLQTAIEQNKEYICDETLADTLQLQTQAPEPAGFRHHVSFDIDGETLVLGLVKA